MSSDDNDSPAAEANTTGFVQALILGAGVAVVLILIFCILRTRVPDVFQLRQLLNTWKEYDDFNGRRVGVMEPIPTDSFFGWVPSVFNTSQEQIVRKIGLDAAVFLRSIRTFFIITACISVLSITILMPIYGTGHKDLSDRDRDSSFVEVKGLRIVSLANVPDQNWRLWFTVIAEIVFAIIVTRFMIQDYAYYAKLRRKYKTSENPANYAISVFDIPADSRNELAIRNRFELMVPGQVADVIVVRDPRQAMKLQAKLEAAVTKREVAELVRSVKETEPQVRPGPLGWQMCHKPTVDAVSYWASEQDKLADQVHDLGSESGPTPSAIVVLSNKRAASILIQANSATRASQWAIEGIPEPNAVNWKAFLTPGDQSESRSLLVSLFMLFFTLFWTIPAGFVVSLFSLEKLSEIKAFEFLVDIASANAVVRGFVQGLLPPIVMAVLVSLIPMLFRYVVSQERIASVAFIEVKTRDYFYFFTVYGSFLVIILSAAFLQNIEEILKNPTMLVDALAREVPGSGLYFATFLLVTGLIPFSLQLSGVVRVIVRWILLKLAKTERQKRKARSAGSLFQYFRHSGGAMLTMFIGLAFASMSPLVSLTALVYFAMAYVTFRYQILNTCYSEWDGGGELFPGTYWGTMIGLVFKQILVIAILSLKKAPAPAAVMTVPTVVTACVSYFAGRRYERIAKNGSIYDLYTESTKADEIPSQYNGLYEQPAGKVTNYRNLNGLSDAGDTYSEVDFDNADNMDAVHSETLDDSVGYVPDRAADREDV